MKKAFPNVYIFLCFISALDFNSTVYKIIDADRQSGNWCTKNKKMIYGDSKWTIW